MSINSKKKIYLIIMAVFVLAVVLKAVQVHYRAKIEAPSMILEWERHGKPVNVFKVDRSDLIFYTKISGTVSGKKIVSFLTPGIAARIRRGNEFFIYHSGERVRGNIVSLSAERDLKSGLHRAELLIRDDVKIPEGSIVTANVESKTIPDLLCVPSVSVVREKEDIYVWLLDSEDKVVKRHIDIGQSNGAKYEVTSGIELGDRIVTSGKTFLEEGDKVRVYMLYECADTAQGLDDFI